jgi:hypothetical protein
MPLVRLSGEAFRRHAGVFRPCRGLHDVKQVEADRLLDLHGGAFAAGAVDIPDADIAATPEILQVLLLGGEQRLEPLLHHAVHRPLCTAADLRRRRRLRRVIHHVFGEVDRSAGLGLDREGDLAKVLGVDDLVGVWVLGLKIVVRGTRQDHLALVGRMAQHDTTLPGIAGSVMEHPPCKRPRLPRVIRVDAGVRRSGHHLRGDHDGGRGVEERHLVGDGGHVPVHERDHTPGGNQHLCACRRLPEELPVERP